eukprot:m51a1_g507 hypothetical protein (196) ;mRNA; r:296184-296960
MKEPFLNTGYRINYTASECIHSVFEWHNETLRIWTHVAAFAVFAVQLAYSQMVLLAGEPYLSVHRLLFAFFSVAIMCSMASSVVFHVFRSSSEEVYSRLITVDFTCIAVSLTGSQMPQMYYAFPSRPLLRRVYMVAYLLAGMAAVAYTQMPTLTAPAWRVVRTGVFCAVGAFNGIATLHAAVLAPQGAKWCASRS